VRVASAQAAALAIQKHDAARRLELCRRASLAVLLACLLYLLNLGHLAVYVTTGSLFGSSAINQLIWLIVLVPAAVMCLLKLPLTIRVLRRAWPTLLVLGWLVATMLWSDHPDLTIHRSLALMIVFVSALGIAVGLRTPRSAVLVFAGAFGIVMLIDLVSLAVPSYSHMAIGVRGIHLHKNTAGFISTLAVVTFLVAFFLVRARAVKFALAAVGLWALVFLMLTQSKTSAGTLLVALLLFPLYWLWIRDRTTRLPHLLVAGLSISVLLFTAVATGFTWKDIGLFFFSDLTFTGRTYIWDVTLAKLASSPWLGFGFGAVWDTGSIYNDMGGSRYEFWNNPDIINQSHNGYIDLMLHGGVVALVLVLLVSFRALANAGSLARAAAVPTMQRFAICMYHCQIVIILLSNFLESSVFFPSSLRAYYCLIILIQLDRWRAEFDAWSQANATSRH
jgi:O-antigen ligase